MIAREQQQDFAFSLAVQSQQWDRQTSFSGRWFNQHLPLNIYSVIF